VQLLGLIEGVLVYVAGVLVAVAAQSAGPALCAACPRGSAARAEAVLSQ
jgi:hypothetical protein